MNRVNSGEIQTVRSRDTVGFGEGFRGCQERMVVAIYRTTCLDEGKTRDRVSKRIGRDGGMYVYVLSFCTCVGKKKKWAPGARKK